MSVSTPLRQYLFDRISVGGFDACWWWKGSVGSRDYGIATFGGRRRRAHRAVYEYLRGSIPDGRVLHHACENKLCVNPRHLDPLLPREHVVTHGNWGRVAAAKRKVRSHCVPGHEFTPENTRINNRGSRVCRTCVRAWNKAHRPRKGER